MRWDSQRRLSAAAVRGLLWRAHMDAWDMYQRLHDRAPELFPYGGDVEREEMRRDALWNLKYEIERLASELEEQER